METLLYTVISFLFFIFFGLQSHWSYEGLPILIMIKPLNTKFYEWTVKLLKFHYYLFSLFLFGPTFSFNFKILIEIYQSSNFYYVKYFLFNNLFIFGFPYPIGKLEHMFLQSLSSVDLVIITYSFNERQSFEHIWSLTLFMSCL